MRIISKESPFCLSEDALVDLDYFPKDYSSVKLKNKKQIILDITIVFIKQFFKDCLSIFNYKPIKNKFVLFFNSINQLNALIPLKFGFENSVYINASNFKCNRIPQSIGILLSFYYLPHFYSILKNSSKPKLLINGKYYLILGMYRWFCYYLKKTKPKAIIFSNDHLLMHRLLKKAAFYNKVPTFYLQHASVVEEFPKLDFDLSLLEGMDALSKYNKKGIDNNVELIGMPKFDRYYNCINSNLVINNIGICTNILESEETLSSFIKELRENFKSMPIFLRPHPADKRLEFYKKLSRQFNLFLSNSQNENSFDFLRKVDLNISGGSSVHLEAVLMNVYPIHYKFNKERYDDYGYLKNGLLLHSFDKVKDVVSHINSIKYNKPNIRNRAKYYVESVNTPYDGKSTEKAIQLIKEHVESYNVNQ